VWNGVHSILVDYFYSLFLGISHRDIIFVDLVLLYVGYRYIIPLGLLRNSFCLDSSDASHPLSDEQLEASLLKGVWGIRDSHASLGMTGN
jgi:hypothetical protein